MAWVDAVAWVKFLAWELPRATGAAKEEKKRGEFLLWRSVKPTNIYEAVGLIPGLTQWVRDLTLL